MNHELKARLNHVRERLQPFGENPPPPDPLTLSIWEWGAELDAMTQAERAAQAAELGISIENLLKIQREIQNQSTSIEVIP